MHSGSEQLPASHRIDQALEAARLGPVVYPGPAALPLRSTDRSPPTHQPTMQPSPPQASPSGLQPRTASNSVACGSSQGPADHPWLLLAHTAAVSGPTCGGSLEPRAVDGECQNSRRTVSPTSEFTARPPLSKLPLPPASRRAVLDPPQSQAFRRHRHACGRPLAR